MKEAIFENKYNVETRISDQDWGLISTQCLGFTDLMVLVEQYNLGLPNEAYLSISLNGTPIAVEDFYPHLAENQLCLNCDHPVPNCPCDIAGYQQ